MHFCPFLYIIKYNFMFAIISWCQHRSRIPGCTITCTYQCAAASPPQKKSPLLFFYPAPCTLSSLATKLICMAFSERTPMFSWYAHFAWWMKHLCSLGHRVSFVISGIGSVGWNAKHVGKCVDALTIWCWAQTRKHRKENRKEISADN